MYLTKKHLSRRTLLRGAGVAVGLPLLDAMIPAGTALAQTAAKPKLRAGFFYMPHGAVMWNTKHGKEMVAGHRAARARISNSAQFSSRSRSTSTS